MRPIPLALMLTIVLLAVGNLTIARDSQSTTFNAKPSFENMSARPHSTLLASPLTISPLQSSAPPANYDEQLGTTFTQSFSSISYNVTAIAQSDANGYGPAYLLNGLTTAGYWYQVGVAYNWPLKSGGYEPGFNLSYNVFDFNGQVVLPTNGGGGLAKFSGPVNSGDQVQLSLYFSQRSVIMLGTDKETGSTASESYSAVRANSFIGSPNAIANSNGFFTGLMTEWYHVDAYYGDDGGVVYSDPGFALSSAWMWMDEFNAITFRPIFSDNTASPVVYSSTPDKSEFLYSHGASDSSNAYAFVTGFSKCSPATVLSPSSIICNGLGPTTIGLTWKMSRNPLFSKYQVQQSTEGPNGPWTITDTITSVSNTTDYIQDLSPNATYWWQIQDVDSSGAKISTDVVQVRQTNNATLSYTALSDTGYRLTWNNSANYTGSVAFNSYQLEESVNGSNYSIVYTSLSSTGNSSSQNLSANTDYSFYLITIDTCSTCSNPRASSSKSNAVAFRTPTELVASATAEPGSFDVGQTVSFICNAAGGVLPYSYSWTFGDGSTGSGQSVTHNYRSAGVMNVACKATDSLQGSNLGITTITILLDPSITSLSSSPSTIDVGQTVQFTAVASGGSGDYTYAWLSLPSGCRSSNTATISCHASAAGSFQVELSVTDSNLVSVISSPFPFYVYADPSILTFSASPSTVEVGQETSLTTSTTGGYSPLSYSYSGLPGCITAKLAILSCSPTATGTYSVTATVSDANGYSVSSSPIIIRVNPGPTAALTATPPTIDVSQRTTFSTIARQGTGSLSYSYMNLPLGCASANATILSCTPQTSGNYTVQVTITDGLGGTAKSFISLMVNPLPTITSFDASSSNITLGQRTTFTVDVEDGTGPYSYSYSGLPPGCTSSDTPTLSCSPSASGNWTVTVVATDHVGESDTTFVSINVSPAPTVLGLSPLVGFSVAAGLIAVAFMGFLIGVVQFMKRKDARRVDPGEPRSRTSLM